jgi:hypothetical protein
VLRNLTRFWAARDGDLVFEIIFDRGWRPGDLDPAAVAIIRCAAALDEQHRVAIFEDRPSWFSVDFTPGHHVHGTLRRQSDVQVDGVACLTVFADVHYREPGCARLFHFDGGMVACPSAANPVRRRPEARPRRTTAKERRSGGMVALVTGCAGEIRMRAFRAPLASLTLRPARTGTHDAL